MSVSDLGNTNMMSPSNRLSTRSDSNVSGRSILRDSQDIVTSEDDIDDGGESSADKIFNAKYQTLLRVYTPADSKVVHCESSLSLIK